MRRNLLVFVMLLGVVGLLNAFPFANYGNVRVPDAYVMPHTMAMISLNNYLYPENNDLDDDYAYNWAGAVNFGLFDFGELGLVFSGDEVFYGHLKARIVRETLALPDIAIGVDNLFAKIRSKEISHSDMIDAGNYRRNSFYFAVSKTTLLSGIPAFGDLPTRVTIGAGSHRFQGTVKFSEQFGGLFGAVQFQPAKGVSLIAEIDGHNLNTGFEYSYSNFAAKLALYKIEEWNRRDPKFGITFSYIFDTYVAPEARGGFSPFREVGDQYMGGRDGRSLDELQRIRIQRERAERELEEIRRLLED